MNLRRRLQRQLVFVLLMPNLLCAAQPLTKSSKPLLKTRVSQSAISSRSAVLWIAHEQGIFAKHGVDVETIYLRTSPMQMTALGTGEVQFAATGGAPILSAIAGGQDAKIISSPSNRLTYDLVVRPEIKEAKDLRGKRLGVTTFGGTTWMAAYLTLEHLGLEANRDQVRINAIGNQTILAQALESGNIDATLLDPFLSRRLRAKGFPTLVELQRAKIPFTNTSMAVSASYVREHPEIVEGVLKGMIEAQAFITMPANRLTVLETIRRYMKLNDPATLEEGYQELLVGYERKPYVSLEGLRNIQRMLATLNPKASRVKVEEVIDNRFVKKLDDGGFIDGLYGK